MSFPPGTEMFQFPGFASYAYEFSIRSPCGGVSPFGHPRINDRSHLPAAFRSVPRPSSPSGAKASTERPCHTQRILTSPPPARRTKPRSHAARPTGAAHHESNPASTKQANTRLPSPDPIHRLKEHAQTRSKPSQETLSREAIDAGSRRASGQTQPTPPTNHGG